MSEHVVLTLTDIGHGGVAIGRDESGRVIFVRYGIPGERAEARITQAKGKSFAYADLWQIMEPSPERVEPRCRHFGTCGGCHFQHIAYERQLTLKRDVVRDQLQRIGGLTNPEVQAVIPHPSPWQYSTELILNATSDGELGLWSPAEHQVIAIEECPITHPLLVDLLHDIDLDLTGLRELRLRVGDDESLLMAFKMDGAEPPALEADFPLSIALVLPDGAAVNLVGDNYVVQTVKGRDFRVSAGSYFQPSPAAAAAVIDTLLKYADLKGNEKVLELHSGVGMLTAFLAAAAAEVVAIEQNGDAIADAVVNLAEMNNVALYEDDVAAALPALNITPNLIVANPPADGLSKQVVQQILDKSPARLIYISCDVATLARDGKGLAAGGYQLVEVQPLDMRPQTYHIETISLWIKEQPGIT